MTDPLLSIAATRRYLGGLSKTKVFELIRDKRLQTAKFGRRTFVTRESADALIEQSTSPRQPADEQAAS